MPVLTKPELFERIRLAFQAAGWALIFDAGSDDHPFSVSISRATEHRKLLIYIWNLTHGGGPARPANEFRIQITGVSPPLHLATDRQTLLLGWSDDFGVFAAFDAVRHQAFTEGSPSIQIRQENLEAAAAGTMSFCPRGNGEIAVALSPDLLSQYVDEQAALHTYGDAPQELHLLEAAAQGETISDDDVAPLSNERKIVVSAVARLSRESRFRMRIMRAYNHGCAVCEIQLGLAEAAHIVPVATPGSTDETSNGIALCPLHHAGYDGAILAISDDYQIFFSEHKLTELESMGLAGGVEAFRAVRDTILLPTVIADRPRPEYLRRGIEVRAFAA